MKKNKPTTLAEVNVKYAKWMRWKAKQPSKKRNFVTRTITIDSAVGENRTSESGRDYVILVVEYTDNKKGEQKTKKTPIFTDEGKMMLDIIEEGASYTVTMIKDSNGFWKWTKMLKYAGGEDEEFNFEK